MRFGMPSLPAVARGAGGVLMGGLVAALVFLVMAQGAFRQGFTDFDYAHILGTAIEGTAEEERGRDALGIIGDSAGPAALYTTIVAGICLLLLHALVIARVVRAHWAVKGVVLGLVAFLAIGLIYVPYAGANLDTPIGLWGVEQGGITPVVLLLSSIGAGIVGARCLDLALKARWWEKDRVVMEEQLAELTGGPGSLELPEEGPEQGPVRS